MKGKIINEKIFMPLKIGEDFLKHAKHKSKMINLKLKILAHPIYRKRKR